MRGWQYVQEKESEGKAQGFLQMLQLQRTQRQGQRFQGQEAEAPCWFGKKKKEKAMIRAAFFAIGAQQKHDI
jgi:hypothetical protein